MQKYNKLVKKYQDSFTEKELDYLQNFEIRMSQFYGLPKLHKSKTISEKCKNAQASYVEVSEIKDL